MVQPGERIDDRTAQLFDRVGSPVLADLKVESDGVKAAEIEPRRLPDLFRGGEVVIAGRYCGSGACRITLRGRAPGGEQALAFDVVFPERDAADFEVARLWARRRVGALFDQVRLNDRPEKELVDEIIALSKKYRVVAPYTSFLISEEGDPSARRGRVLREMAALRSRASVGGRADAKDGIRALEDSRRLMEARK